MILLAPFRAFWDFWAKPIRAESLALFRILLGLTTLATILTGFGQSLTLTCGPDGLCPAKACDGWLAHTSRLCLLRGPVSLPVLSDWLPEGLAKRFPWLNKQLSAERARAWTEWGARPSSAYLLFGLFVLSLVTMTVGIFPRLSVLVALILANTFYGRLSWLTNGGDSLYRNGLYFLLLSPLGATWSLDRYLWRRLRGLPDPGPVMIAPWSVRLMQIQICIMYFFTGVYKLGDGFDPDLIDEKGWLAFLLNFGKGDYINGQALYWVLNDVAICRWPYNAVLFPYFVCRLMSWGTLIFEVGFSFFILIRPLRKYLLLAGLALHLGIMAVMEIGWFSQITMCWYVLFVPGEQVRGFFHRLFSRRTPAMTPAQAPVAA
jgi:hypothetical protein